MPIVPTWRWSTDRDSPAQALSFPKKKDADFIEPTALIEATTGIGRLNAHFVFSEMQGMFPSKDTTPVQKAQLCHSLGTLARDHPREVSGYNGTFGPLMLQYMESDFPRLSVNAIRSFPYVTVPDATQERNIVRKVAQVAVVQGEPEVAETAFASLSAYLLQMVSCRRMSTTHPDTLTRR